MHLDAHEKPPEYLRAKFKRYRGRRAQEVEADRDVLDFTRPDKEGIHENQASCVTAEQLHAAFRRLSWHDGASRALSLTDIMPSYDGLQLVDKQAYEVDEVPGLVVLPQLLPKSMQMDLLDRLLHRDLSNPIHRTNVNLHHDLHYPGQNLSFFDASPSATPLASPKDPAMHKPLAASQLLSRKLRWMTLGGQYDWTRKEYPPNQPPAFPSDISQLLRALFPQTTAEAAIVNIYSPGDILSVHRDVSEESEQPLISISIGCDALFLIGLDPSPGEMEGKHALVRLRSGDAVYMTEQSRFAWHGVPSIVADTCPHSLRSWPAARTGSDNDAPHERFEAWQGWLASKRINLNVRQMSKSA